MMKLRIILTAMVVFALSASGVNVIAQSKKPAMVKKKTTNPVAAKPSLTSPEDITEGKLLISKSDCMICHGMEAKMIGPSYLSVAEKYPLNAENISGLSKKIIDGGSGVWGTVPMTAHPALSPADATKMVKYILSLKKP